MAYARATDEHLLEWLTLYPVNPGSSEGWGSASVPRNRPIASLFTAQDSFNNS